jgi:uncharacterized membrane protein HdeD (DUF308 family)
MTDEAMSRAGKEFRGHWLLAAAGGGLILLLGLVLLLLPVASRNAFAQTTGWFLVAAAGIEFGVGLRGSPSVEGRITLLLSAVTAAAAILVLLRPDAYPLFFVAIVCLAIRGVGAVVAAGIGAAGLQRWVLARGIVDAVLAITLVAGAPLAAVISTLSGKKWPPSGHAVLGNFIGISMIAAGLCLLGLALTKRGGSARNADDAERPPAAASQR